MQLQVDNLGNKLVKIKPSVFRGSILFWEGLLNE
jgi:hypothetical protein